MVWIPALLCTLIAVANPAAMNSTVSAQLTGKVHPIERRYQMHLSGRGLNSLVSIHIPKADAEHGENEYGGGSSRDKLHQICTGALHSPRIIATTLLCVFQIDIPDVLPKVRIMLGAAHKECFECWMKENAVETTHAFMNEKMADLSLIILKNSVAESTYVNFFPQPEAEYDDSHGAVLIGIRYHAPVDINGNPRKYLATARLPPGGRIVAEYNRIDLRINQTLTLLQNNNFATGSLLFQHGKLVGLCKHSYYNVNHDLGEQKDATFDYYIVRKHEVNSIAEELTFPPSSDC